MFKSVVTVDPAMLIEEVRKRPVLYDSRGGCVSSFVRRNTWFEVSDVFIENWNCMTTIDKENISREMQAKWQALRDRYRKALRIQERDQRLGLNSSRRSKFYYFDQLSFLAEHCGPKGHKPAYSSTKTDENDSSSNPLDYKQESTDYSGSEVTPDFVFLPSNIENNSPSAIKVESNECPSPSAKRSLIEDLEEKNDLDQKLVAALEELKAMQKKEKAMGKERFLLSLFPTRTEEGHTQKEEEEELYPPLPANNYSSLLNTEIDIKNEPDSPVKMEEPNEMEFVDMEASALTVKSEFPSHHEQTTHGFENIENLLNEVVTLKIAQTPHDDNGNGKFLLSLLPIMKKLSTAANMKLRVEMLKLVQNFQEEQPL